MTLKKEKLWILSYGALLIALLYLLYLRYNIIFNYSPDVSGSEKNVIYGIQRLLDGLPLYSDPTLIEFNLIQYPPLYFRLVSSVCSMLNIGSENPHATYIASRICSLILVISSALIYGTILKKYNFDNLFCASAVVLILFLHSANMLTNSRPDSLLSFLVACFLYSGIRYIETVNPTWNFLTVLCAILAVWTKQNGFTLFLCWFLLLIFNGFHRQTYYNILIFILSISVLVVLETTDIRILKLNLIDGVRNGIDLSEFKNWILFKLWPLLPILGIATYFCKKWLFISSASSDKAKQFIALTCLLLFFFNILASLKLGSRIGYLTDFFCVAIIGSYIFIRDYAKEKDYKTILAGSWLIATVYFGIFSTLFVSDCQTASHLEMYRKEKSLAKYIKDNYLTEHPKTRVIVIESFFAGQWTKQFLFKHISAFASDALDMSPLDYSRFPKYVNSRETRYLIRFKPTNIETLGYKLKQPKFIAIYDGVEIYCLRCDEQVNSQGNFTASLTY